MRKRQTWLGLGIGGSKRSEANLVPAREFGVFNKALLRGRLAG